jgi:NAD+ synthase
MNPIDTSDRIEKWLATKVKETNAKGVVVGMSGGVDSSVVAAIAKRALGKNVLGVILPCDSNPKDAKFAQLVAKKFGIETRRINLTPVFRQFRKSLPPGGKKIHGNLKARLRMAALYYFANKHNYLVLGTSNRSELWIGYFTKHGDAAADLEPIGGLYKTQIVELAKHLGIPKEIIKAKPSAGLWKGQTDEKEIGMGYGQLDLILWSMENGKQQTSRQAAKVMDMINRSRHKRKMPEICEISN